MFSAAWFVGSHKEARAIKPLIGALNTAPAGARYAVVVALGQIGGDEAIDALIPLLHFNGWAARGEGNPPRFSDDPPDGRRVIVSALVKLKAAKATPAMLALLAEPGEAQDYVGVHVVPFLAEHGGLECVPELRRVAGSRHYSPEFRARAAAAADKIAGRNG